MPYVEGIIAGVLANGASCAAANVHDRVIKLFQTEKSLSSTFDNILADRIERRAEQLDNTALANLSHNWSVVSEEIDIYAQTFGTDTEALDWLVREVAEHEAVDLYREERLELRTILEDEYEAAVATFHRRVAEDVQMQRQFQTDLGLEIRSELETLVKQINEPKVYKSLPEFRERLFSQQQYVSVTAEYDVFESSVSSNSEEVDDVRAEVVDLIRAGTDIIRIYGEGGLGKSRLLEAVGESLQDQFEIHYATNSGAVKPPNLNDDAILFVDNAGREDMDWFLKRASFGERAEENKQYRLQVVAVARSVYEDEVDRVIGQFPNLTNAKLHLQPLDWEQTNELLNSYNLSTDSKKKLYSIGRGNAFFTVMLAELALSSDDDKPATIRNALNQVVGQMTNTDLEQIGQNTEDIRTLLNALAVWEIFTHPEDASKLARFGQVFERTMKVSRWLRTLASKGYVDEGGDVANSVNYTLRHDVVTDYLRLELLTSDDERFQDYAHPILDTKVPSMTSGLVTLLSSPVIEFYHDDIKKVIEDRLTWLSTAVLDEDVPRSKVFITQAYVATAVPDAVNHDRLQEIVEECENPSAYLEPIVVTADRFASLTARNSKWAEETERWVAHLDVVTPEIHNRPKLLGALYFNIVVNHAKGKQFDQVEERLDDLAKLYTDFQLVELHDYLIRGISAVINESAKSRQYQILESMLGRLERRYETQGDSRALNELVKSMYVTIHVLSQSLVGGTMSEDMLRIDELIDRMDRLENEYEETNTLTNKIDSQEIFLPTITNLHRRDEELARRFLRHLHGKLDPEIWTTIIDDIEWFDSPQ